MKTSLFWLSPMMGLLTVPLCLPVFAAGAPPKASRPAIYDESADGAKQIGDARVVPKTDRNRVLLQIGAKWCGWCHRLHGLFQTNAPIAAKFKEACVVVLIDVNKEHDADIDQKYGKPTQHGMPVIVVLDGEGKPLTTQDTGKVEEGDHHDPAKVLAFLNQWAPEQP